MSFDQDRLQDDFDFEDDENDDPFDISSDTEFVYCFGCFAISGTVSNLTALRETEDWIRDKDGRVFSKYICDMCIEKIPEQDVSKFQMNPMFQTNTNKDKKADGGKSKTKFNDLVKSLNLKSRLTQVKKGDVDGKNANDNQ